MSFCLNVDNTNEDTHSNLSMKEGQGREGDWECSGCANRNYAFRSYCNRCKQPRILVDHKTPADSKWLPRIGDWICSGMHIHFSLLSLPIYFSYKCCL